MKDNLQDIRISVEPYIGTLVLDGFDVVKFHGVADFEQEEDPDYYWIFEKLDGTQYFSSAVGRFVGLIGHVHDADYKYLASIWNYNAKVKEI